MSSICYAADGNSDNWFIFKFDCAETREAWEEAAYGEALGAKRPFHYDDVSIAAVEELNVITEDVLEAAQAYSAETGEEIDVYFFEHGYVYEDEAGEFTA